MTDWINKPLSFRFRNESRYLHVDCIVGLELVVIKRFPKPCLTITLSAKIDVIRLTSYHRLTCVSNFRNFIKRWLCKVSCRIRIVEHSVALFARNCKQFAILLHIKERDVVQEILQSHPSLLPRKFETQDCQWYGGKRIKSTFVDKGNNGTMFGTPFYYWNSSHFNKTDLSRQRN